MLSVKEDTSKNSHRLKIGKGLVNSLINKLPFELHLPGGYQYCGPGTKLQKRLTRGDPGINKLDAACKQHDIAYDKNTSDLTARHKADYQLEQAAWKRVKSKDASFKEKAAAWLVTTIMKGKQRIGMGCTSTTNRKNIIKKKSKHKKNPKKIAFGAGIVRKVRDDLRKAGGKRSIAKNTRKVTQMALLAARRHMRAAGGKRNIRTPRIIPIPKVGGILPLIPIFAGLSALGSLAGSATGIVKAINDVKTSREELAEKNRHNRQMEAIAIGKTGKGLYLKPYRKGLGLYLKPQNSKNY